MMNCYIAILTQPLSLILNISQWQMEDTSRPKGRKQMRLSSLAKENNKETYVDKKVSTKIMAGVKPPQLISMLGFNQSDHNSHNEAIYMDEDLYCINDKQKLKELLHRSVGALTFLNPYNKIGFGSGVLISQDTVLTAAHNIYQRSLRQKNKGFRFYLGANGETQHFYQIQSWKYPEEYQKCDKSIDRLYDYAIMKLKKRVIHFKEFLKMKIPCSICFDWSQLSIYGFPATQQLYPNEKPKPYKDNYKSLTEDGKKIKLHQYGLRRKDRIKFYDIYSGKMGYEMSTLPGQSGSPVIVNGQIIAIHLGNGLLKTSNEGRIIDKEVSRNVQKWRGELQTQNFQIEKENKCAHSPFHTGTFIFNDKAKNEMLGFGIVISKNLVLTVAHNLFNRDEQANYQNIRFYLGSTIKVGQRFLQIQSFEYPQQFKTCNSFQENLYDYALVKLKGDVPFDNFMQIALPCLECIRKEDHRILLQLYGFPKYNSYYGGKKEKIELLKERAQSIQLFQHEIRRANILELDSSRSQLICSIVNYQSRNGGAPLVNNNQIIGLHKVGKQSGNFKVIRIFDQKFIDNIEAWSEYMNGEKFSCVRKRCYHTKIYPIQKLNPHIIENFINRSICGVQARYINRNSVVGTGVLLSKDIVLTAAQNCFKNGNWLSYIKIYMPECDGISRDCYQVQSFRYNQQYKILRQKDERVCYDYVLLKLKRPVNHDYFPKIALPCQKCLLKQNKTCLSQIISLPHRLDNWKIWEDTLKHNQIQHIKLVQYKSEGKNAIIKIRNQFEIRYNLQTGLGTAGSPVIFKDKIIAIHIGNQRTNSQILMIHNDFYSQIIDVERIGRLITPDLVANIKKWCHQLKGQDFQVIKEDHICK